MNPSAPENDPYTDHNTDSVQRLLDDPPPADEGDGPTGDSFIIIYTTLMMLLLAFFLVLFSLATTSTGKFSHARDSIQNEFSTMGLSTAKKTLAFMYSLMKIKSAFNPVMHPLLQEDTKPADDFAMKKKDQVTKVYWTENENVDVTAKMGDLILLGINAERQQSDLLLRIPTLKLFYPDNAKLTPAGKVIITNMLNIIKTNFEKITIHSYCDEGNSSPDPFSKNSFVLSTERAYAVAQEIADQLQVPISKIPFYGYGKHRPADPSSKLGADAFNNRIELWIRELWTHDENGNDVAPAAEQPTPPTDKASSPS
jgi:flagellar motor protein MotB